MIAFIDDHQGAYGVEPICSVLPITPSTYRAHIAKRRDPSLLSDRAKRDAQLRPEIARVFEENFRVYGARKVWHQLRREGFDVARCTVERLMKEMGIAGAMRSRTIKTTVPNKAQPCPLDSKRPAGPYSTTSMIWAMTGPIRLKCWSCLMPR